MEQHRLSKLFPTMSDDDYSHLRNDVKQAQHLIHPIVTYQGEILDGWHRQRACDETGVKPEYIEFEGNDNDAAAYVRSANEARRHLNHVERAELAVSYLAYHKEQAKKRQRAAGGDKRPLPVPGPEASKDGQNQQVTMHDGLDFDQGEARERAGKQAGTSGASTQRMKTILDRGAPELVEKVRANEIPLQEGAKIAMMPKDRQQRVLSQPTPQLRKKVMEQSINIANAKKNAHKRKGRTDSVPAVPGTPLVLALMLQLEQISNQISKSGLTPTEFAKRFQDEFEEVNAPPLIRRLDYAGQAIDMIALLQHFARRLRKSAA